MQARAADFRQRRPWPPVALQRLLLVALSVLCVTVGHLWAAVLPEDRADAMFHSYDGGGVQVTGPALLVREGFADTVSLSASYYVDDITSASIDVVTNASEYTERRDELGVGMDYLRENTIMNVSYTISDENDYNAHTYGLGVSHEVFGGMTTLSMGYSRGADTVLKTTDSFFEEKIDRDQFTLGVAQVLSRRAILSMAYDLISDEGFLNNPYRGVIVIAGAPTPPITWTDPEVYPPTRRSHAASLGAKYHLSSGAAVSVNGRDFHDTWGIDANDFELSYSRYFGGKRWLVDTHYRYYTQSKASFYADYFPTFQNYMARDKELSTFDSHSVGLQLGYSFTKGGWGPGYKGTFNLSYEYLFFDYEDFTDLREDKSTFGEPYSFGAHVVELFLSLWF